MNWFLIIFISISTLLCVFFVHILLWRALRPKKHMQSIILTFLLIPTPLVLLIACYLFPSSKEEILATIFLYWALACSYVQTYPAIQANSPTLKIASFLRSKKEGARFEDIQNLFTQGKLVEERLNDLKHDGLINVDQHENLTLSPVGKMMACCFLFYRKLLGLPHGDG